MTKASSASVQRPYHHGNLREEMIRCGREILSSEGIHGLTLRSAARMAGVSHGAPRNQFADKEGLLAAIATEGFLELVAVRRARLSSGMTAETRLLYVMDGYIEFAIEQPALFFLMFGPQIVGKEHYPDLLAAGNASYELLHGAVKDYFDELGVSERFSELKVRCAWSAVHGLSMFYSDRPTGPSLIRKVPFEQWRQGLLSFILAGLTAFDESTTPATTRSVKKVVKPHAKKRPADDTGAA
ncbi:TetR/AcrR family transcriptional regulator [Paraburkholderia panacisoli]|jgi:AcrR family transcriptional regulator|uniref:TetR/AcrR family transcriptional regulator n=2 Tax=Paraburkholderia panacisoli TaxID=2603818 RepID=A0A5B0GN27_9BURK|nr:TetR/AcrR family transcriptional regulator [Paraburkholderia panacisoli]